MTPPEPRQAKKSPGAGPFAENRRDIEDVSRFRSAARDARLQKSSGMSPVQTMIANGSRSEDARKSGRDGLSLNDAASAQGDSAKPGVSLGEDTECVASVAPNHPDDPRRRTGDAPGRREDATRRVSDRGRGCRNGRRPARAGRRPETCRGRRRPRGAGSTRRRPSRAIRRRNRQSPCGNRGSEVRSARRRSPSAWALFSRYVYPVDLHTCIGDFRPMQPSLVKHPGQGIFRRLPVDSSSRSVSHGLVLASGLKSATRRYSRPSAHAGIASLGARQESRARARSVVDHDCRESGLLAFGHPSGSPANASAQERMP